MKTGDQGKESKKLQETKVKTEDQGDERWPRKKKGDQCEMRRPSRLGDHDIHMTPVVLQLRR